MTTRGKRLKLEDIPVMNLGRYMLDKMKNFKDQEALVSTLYLFGMSYLSLVFAWGNSIDPDQTPQNAASDQGLNCLSGIVQEPVSGSFVPWSYKLCKVAGSPYACM